MEPIEVRSGAIKAVKLGLDILVKLEAHDAVLAIVAVYATELPRPEGQKTPKDELLHDAIRELRSIGERILEITSEEEPHVN